MPFHLPRTYGPELFRVFVVSLVALTVDTSILTLATELLSIHYLISALIGFLAGLITNYLLSVSWAFQARTVTDQRKEFLLFCLVGIIGLILNQLLLWTLTDLAHLHYLTSKVISVVLVFFWNYGARKTLLFSPRST